MKKNERKLSGMGDKVLEAAMWILIVGTILYYLLTN